MKTIRGEASREETGDPLRGSPFWNRERESRSNRSGRVSVSVVGSWQASIRGREEAILFLVRAEVLRAPCFDDTLLGEARNYDRIARGLENRGKGVRVEPVSRAEGKLRGSGTAERVAREWMQGETEIESLKKRYTACALSFSGRCRPSPRRSRASRVPRRSFPRFAAPEYSGDLSPTRRTRPSPSIFARTKNNRLVARSRSTRVDISRNALRTRSKSLALRKRRIARANRGFPREGRIGFPTIAPASVRSRANVVTTIYRVKG